VSDRHTNIDQDILAIRVRNDARQHLPGVEEGVSFEEVVQAAIAGDLELRPDAKSCSSCFCSADTFDDAFGVALEIESPLVERAVRGQQ
jgi:hypothetical protein